MTKSRANQRALAATETTTGDFVGEDLHELNRPESTVTGFESAVNPGEFGTRVNLIGEYSKQRRCANDDHHADQSRSERPFPGSHGPRADSRGGDYGHLWRIRRPDQAQAAASPLSSGAGGAVAGKIRHCGRGAAVAGRCV